MNDSPSFLERVATFLLQQDGKSLLQTLVVLPNRRSQVFLKQALANKSDKDFWLPDMLTIDELMARLSGLTVVDPMLAWFELYRIHRELEGENARSLDDFLSWAPLMLNDFSDIDFSLADAKKVFRELSEAKALEVWNLGERPLTAMQKDYLAFFHRLYDYYKRLGDKLLGNKTAYKALTYRLAAEKMQKGQTGDVEWKTFVFVGFNALTGAEKQVVLALQQYFALHYFIQADTYYFDLHKGSVHEAGRFLREMTRALKIESPRWVGDNLLTRKKSVEVYGIPGHTGQAKLAGQLLHQWLVEEGREAVNTAVVLADERLLVPLLEAVPSEDAKGEPLHYNVTMGYPLQESPFYDFVYRWLQLLVLRSEGLSTKGRISLPMLELLLQNPLAEMLTGMRLSDFYPMTRVYASGEEIWQAAPEGPMKNLLENLFYGWDKPADFLKQLKKILLQIQALPALEEKQNRLLPYQWMLTMQMLKLMEYLVGGKQADLGFQGLQKVLLQLLGRKEVSLKGEPLTGIQVMGMLETRNLDFDRVIILGANEGVLPKTGFQESFIPYDLRRAFGLPMQNTQTVVTSYHFFRLLQSAGQVALIYNSEPDVLGGGEVSRFVLQIENELKLLNPQLMFRKKMVYVPLKTVSLKQTTQAVKEPDILKQLQELAQYGFSPSALNTYVRCPLQFYFRYVARVEVPDIPEVSVQSTTFGSVVHGVLEAFYQPFVGKYIDPDLLYGNVKKNLEGLLQQKFLEIYGNNDFNSGRNVLIYNVAKRYVERFIKNDVQNLRKEPRILIGTEQKVRAALSLSDADIYIKGTIDRMDKTEQGNAIRIIDYKTGSVETRELRINSWEELTEKPDYGKALQVTAYAWAYQKQTGESLLLLPGIISLKKADGKFLPVVFPEGEEQKDVLNQAENALHQLTSEILDAEMPFVQTQVADICKTCDFKNLCNR